MIVSLTHDEFPLVTIEMTVDEARARIVEYFSRPGAKLGKDAHGACTYHSERSGQDVRKCAVGCLITDVQYDPRIDDDIVVEDDGEATYINPEIEDMLDHNVIQAIGPGLAAFLIRAQDTHDTSGNVTEFLRRMKEV